MRKFLHLMLMLVAMLPFAACGGSDDDGGADDSSVVNNFIGEWYASYENSVYSFSFDKNGNAGLVIYSWENKAWTSIAYKGEYTVNDREYNIALRTKSDAVNTSLVYTGTYIRTGNNISVTVKDNATLMFKKFSGNKDDLADVFKDIEENWLDVTPDNSYEEGSYFDNASNIRSALNGAYLYSADFCRKQLVVENALLTGKTLSGDFFILDADNEDIESLWNAGFKTVNLTNRIINYAPKVEGAERYADVAEALRAFVYYNMAMLWGNVPYAAECMDEAEDWAKATQVSANEIYNDLLARLVNINILEENSEDRRYMSNAAVRFLEKEISLSLKKEYALDVPSEDNIFFFDLQYNPDSYVQWLTTTSLVYTRQYATLLNSEAELSASDLIKEWKSNGDFRYGYWAMLKRIGKAKEVANKKDYELLLPIPSKELYSNPNIKQNEGY